MNRHVAFALLAVTALSSAAFAAEDPVVPKGSNDSRIRTVDYSDKWVTRITSTNKVPVVIVFGEGQLTKLIAGHETMDVTPKDGLDVKSAAEAEQAAKQACADPNGPRWCVDRYSNELTLQPVKDDDGSMLVVTTEKTNDAGVVLRYHYSYELRTRTGRMTDALDKDGKPIPGQSYDKDAYFKVTYTYSSEELAQKQAAWRAAHQNDVDARQRAKMADALTLAQFGGPERSFQWTGGDSEACKQLGKPTRVSDNGQFTTLYFPKNVPISIPNRVNDDKERSETKLNWHSRQAPDSGSLMVIDEVPKQFVLRRDNLACLFVRDAQAQWPVIPYTGTSSPDVVREVAAPYVRQAARK